MCSGLFFAGTYLYSMQTLTALITGANKSIGFEVARILARAGYHVFLGSRDRDKGEKAAERLIAEGSIANGGKIEVIVIDVSSEDSVSAAAKSLSQRVTSLDVLIIGAAKNRQCNIRSGLSYVA
jgi:NAD(P)-dependent dehydrogenase (short-subunit alcohol dehydrogenase family)